MSVRLNPEQRSLRDREIVRRFRAGERLDEIARAVGLSSSGVWRALDRLNALTRPMPIRPRRADARRTGPKPVWPDCPPHLQHHYRKIRALIGSRAARDQLLRIEAQRPQEQGDAI